MAYSVLIPGAIAAKNVDAYNKFAVYSSAIVENGNIVKLGALSTNSGEAEVYVAATPATATLATDIFYMVNEPAIPVVDSKYKGLIDDPTAFAVAAGKVFGVFRPQVGDEIIISEDGLAGTKSTNTFVVPANNTLDLTWAASSSGVSLAYELVETTFITIPSATFYGGRKTAYKFRCVAA